MAGKTYEMQLNLNEENKITMAKIIASNERLRNHFFNCNIENCGFQCLKKLLVIAEMITKLKSDPKDIIDDEGVDEIFFSNEYFKILGV